MNDTRFLRSLASNIKKRSIEYPPLEVMGEGAKRLDEMYVNEIHTYNDFINWYEIHYYHKKSKCKRDLIFCLVMPYLMVIQRMHC